MKQGEKGIQKIVDRVDQAARALKILADIAAEAAALSSTGCADYCSRSSASPSA